MNYRIIAYIVGWVLNLQAIFMALPSLTAVIYNEEDISAFLITMVATIITFIYEKKGVNYDS